MTLRKISQQEAYQILDERNALADRVRRLEAELERVKGEIHCSVAPRASDSSNDGFWWQQSPLAD